MFEVIKNELEVLRRIFHFSISHHYGEQLRIGFFKVRNLNVDFEAVTAVISPKFNPNLICWHSVVTPSQETHLLIGDALATAFGTALSVFKIFFLT